MSGVVKGTLELGMDVHIKDIRAAHFVMDDDDERTTADADHGIGQKRHSAYLPKIRPE